MFLQLGQDLLTTTTVILDLYQQLARETYRKYEIFLLFTHLGMTTRTDFGYI